MFHGLIYYTDIDIHPLLDFREKYDPPFTVISDHIGIIFPIPHQISEADISDHILRVLSGWQPFEVHIDGYIKIGITGYSLPLMKGMRT